jgi:hypothetical protein
LPGLTPATVVAPQTVVVTATPEAAGISATPVAAPGAAGGHILEYRASGCAGDLTYRNASGGTDQRRNVTLPWHAMFRVASGFLASVSVQNRCPSYLGATSCQVLVDGQVFRRANSTGANVVASCSGRLP